MSKIDRTSDDVLIAWISVCSTLLGELKDIMKMLDSSSRGLARLDRVLGQMIAVKGMKNPIFVVRLSAYIEHFIIMINLLKAKHC